MDAHMAGLTLAAETFIQQRALAAASCGIAIADARLPDMPLIYVNEAFTEISGYTADEVMGLNCRFLQGQDRDQEALRPLRAALKAGDACHVVLRNYRKDGRLFWNDLHMAPVHDVQGQLTHFVGVQTDITARVEAEQALVAEHTRLEAALRDLREAQMMLVHAEKMNALGQMVAGLAHEINNPIAFVHSNLHSLRAELDEILDSHDVMLKHERPLGDADPVETSQERLGFVRSDFDELIDSSIDGVLRVKRLVQALRAFARLDEAEDKDATIRDCVDSALTIASGLLGDRVSVTLDLDHLPAIRCYPAELNQVFLNLIMNAGQSIPAGRAGRIHISGSDEGPALRVTVADNGSGMPAEVQARLFTPFFTTKPAGEGVGLGLAISHRIITERHRGTISVESAVGRGTTFTMMLPKDALV
jgi:PAS domain S-box-containing protein